MMKPYMFLLVAVAATLASEAFLAKLNFGIPKTTSTLAMQMTVLTYNGKKKNFKAGSPLSVAVAQLGVPVKYSCKK